MDTMTAAGADGLLDAARDLHSSRKVVSGPYDRRTASLRAPVPARREHSQHVEKLALELFDDLRETHRLTGADRLLLACAARLHDARLVDLLIWDDSRCAESFGSARIGCLSDRESMMVAAISQHTIEGAMTCEPAFESAFDPDERRTVRWCGAILRTADAFDASRSGSVSSLLARCDDGRLVIVAGSESGGSGDVEVARDSAGILACMAGAALHVTQVMLDIGVDACPSRGPSE